jgi:hypothetical protein
MLVLLATILAPLVLIVYLGQQKIFPVYVRGDRSLMRKRIQ